MSAFGAGDLGTPGAANGRCGIASSAEIQEIQDGSISAPSQVLIENVIVTAASTSLFYVQEPQGETTPAHVYPQFAGILVTFGGIPAVGDCVTIEGQVEGSLPQIAATSVVAAAGCGATPLPLTVSIPDIATDVDPSTAGEQPGPLAEALEGVLVRVDTVEVTAAPDGFGEFPIVHNVQDTAVLYVDDLLFSIPDNLGAVMQGSTFQSLTGVLGGTNRFRLLPRSAADVEQ